MKELHRPPPLRPGQTSTQARYLTTSTTAAQRLRAVGLRGPQLPDGFWVGSTSTLLDAVEAGAAELAVVA